MAALKKGQAIPIQSLLFFPPFNVAAASSAEQERGLSMKYVVIIIDFAY